ncbi:Ribonuclease HI [invertebrate metagenome]|uniref:ribonuclease H n=1 Tax=invertebrate metagenome TaxID=1711999 RepID=A0A2H9T750_9ZZZZ
MKVVELYTDGACKGNPGPGGWGVFMRYGHHEKTLYGGEAHTTNNRMELTAAINGLSVLKRPCQVKLFTDSQYVKRGITEWITGWKKRNWKSSGGHSIKNQDLWQKLDELSYQHTIEWCWVKGHAGHSENEMADSLACKGADEMKTKKQN